mgnify:CR=1 FL=1
MPAKNQVGAVRCHSSVVLAQLHAVVEARSARERVAGDEVGSFRR